MTDETELQDAEDMARMESAVQTVKDVLWRFEEGCQGRRSLYEVLGCVVEDLVTEGACAACIQETVDHVFNAIGADAAQHRDDQDSVFH